MACATRATQTSSSLGRQRDLPRPPELPVPRQQRHAVHHARCGDDLVGQVATDVEVANGPADIQRDRPGVHARQQSRQLRSVEVYLDPTQLHQLRELPERNGGDAPRIGLEQPPLFGGELSRERVDQDVEGGPEGPRLRTVTTALGLSCFDDADRAVRGVHRHELESG